jgi:aminopeptidase N
VEPKTSEKANKVLLPDAVVPTHYDLELYPNTARRTYHGVVHIHFQVNSQATSAALHAHSKLTITSAEQGASPVRFEHAPPNLVLFTDDFSSPVTIAFDGTLDGRTGFYAMSRTSCATRFEAEWAREAFPCFDEPRIRSTMTLHLRVPAGLIGVSNCPAESRDADNVVTFAKTQPLPTYLFAWCIDNFSTVSGATSRGLPVDVYYRKVSPAASRAREILADEIRIVEFLEDFYQLPLPFPRMQIVLLYVLGAGGVENFGMIALLESLVRQQDVRSLRDLLIHETIHMWAGDIVTLKSWHNLWLNEGFARSLPKLFARDIFGDGNLLEKWIVETMPAVMDLDFLPASPHAIIPASYDNPRSLFDSISYDKAGFVLSMIRRYIGPTAIDRQSGSSSPSTRGRSGWTSFWGASRRLGTAEYSDAGLSSPGIQSSSSTMRAWSARHRSRRAPTITGCRGRSRW